MQGRLGQAFAKGLSESLPKEVEHQRLSHGLKNLAQKSGELSPEQYLSEAYGIKGITPSMVEQFGRMAERKRQANALNDFQKQETQQNQPQTKFPETNEPSKGKNIPSITKEEPLAAIQEGYIPKTQDEIIEDAKNRYNSNPSLYGNDPNKAIEAAENAEIRREKISNAYSKLHENLTAVQDNVINRLKDFSNKLGVNVPPNQYSLIENKAVQATKPKKDGGEGLTEHQAMKTYGDELDKVSREYEKVNEVGNWGIVARKPGETLRNIKAIQKGFKARNDTENLADKLIAVNKLSPKMAYSLAQPVSDVKQLSSELSKLPAIFETRSEDPVHETAQIAPILAKHLGDGSPLSVAHELDKKGYDGETWLKYIDDNAKDLDIKFNQKEQLKRPVDMFGTFNDWWLSSWSGIE